MKETKRLDYLDSIRGIAALVVMLGHCWLTNTSDLGKLHSDLATALGSTTNLLFFIHGKFHEVSRAAVIMFFVLSGFVLAYSLLKQKTSYASYAVKRVFRIYPAFLFVILASYALHNLIGVQHDVSSIWFKEVINPDLSLSMLIKNLLLWGTQGSMGLDGVIWTLVHEIRISLIFPFIIFTLSIYRWRSIVVYWLTSIACTLYILYTTGEVAHGYGETSFIRTFLNTGYFIIFFAGGAYLAIEREKVSIKIAGFSKWKQILLFVFSGYCLIKTDYDPHTLMGSVVDYMRGIGALGLIALALGWNKFRSALSHAILIWLGRISYSLYLVHIPILYAVNQTVGSSWSVMQTGIVVIILSLLAAELIARTIEFPSIKLGKKICTKLG